MTGIHYLDANATQSLRPQAMAAMADAWTVGGNPSSVHAAGRAARRVMEDAREAIAARFGARPANLVFTSGGTEADALAIRAMGEGRRLVISAIEHDAIRAAARDVPSIPALGAPRISTLDVSRTVARDAASDGAAIVLPVDVGGVADLDALARILGDGVPSLVCLMLANNETGVVQPVEQAAALCRRFGALLHTDAVQAAGRMPVRLDDLGAHSLALSAHKLGGPIGTGALLLAPDAPFAHALIAGGGQERGRRGGTSPFPLFAGFAAAAEASAADDLERLRILRDRLEAAACTAGAIAIGAGGTRLPNTTCLALPGVRADAQVIAMDLEKIAVSAGAACSSGKVATSHVLEAMGQGALAGEAIRVSLPWNVGEADIEAFIGAYPRVAARLRGR